MTRLLFGILLLLSSPRLMAQAAVTCPSNIGFEMGGFNNWECFEGVINSNGALDLFPTSPVLNVHTIIERTPVPVMDPYGNFPISCPNGSKYSIRLGNDETRSGAERVSYTFQIPANQNNYSIIYNYAVVIENPTHAAYQQPKFTTAVFDVSAGSYIQCASFEFVASSSLPGFILSPVFPNVYYKPWAAVTIDLKGFAGKTIRLEFTNNDCTLGGHFGYAYLDVNENCNSPIKGNVACGNSNSITLRAPFGFQEYRWYNANFTQLLGTSANLTLNPIPPAGTVFAVELIPFPGLGCLDTAYTDVSKVADVITLNTPDTVRGCAEPGINLALPIITAGSSPNLTFSYYLDEDLSVYVPTANLITESGNYYINAVNDLGCNVTKKVYVDIIPPPVITYAEPVWGCYPDLVNLTDPALFTGTDPGLTMSWWKDPATTNPLQAPNAVAPGIYYVKGVGPTGCTTVKPLTVQQAKMVTWDVTNCSRVDLTSTANTTGSSDGFTFTYWADSLATIPVSDPRNITQTGRYFIRGVHMGGCVQVKGLQVSIISPAGFTVTDPPEVKYPGNVDITAYVGNTSNLAISYWEDSLGLVKLKNPTSIITAGTYYVKGTTVDGCSVMKAIQVRIKLPDPAKVEAPNAFSPNGDGVNDVFQVKVEGPLRKIEFRVYNRWGTLVFHTNKPVAEWDGGNLPTGTYYWTLDAEDSYRKEKVQTSGSVTLIR